MPLKTTRYRSSQGRAVRARLTRRKQPVRSKRPTPVRGTPILPPIHLGKSDATMYGSYWKALVIQVWIGLLVLGDLYAQGNQQSDGPQTRHEGIPTPLTDRPGDAERGRRIVLDRERGDCVCVMPCRKEQTCLPISRQMLTGLLFCPNVASTARWGYPWTISGTAIPLLSCACDC